MSLDYVFVILQEKKRVAHHHLHHNLEHNAQFKCVCSYSFCRALKLTHVLQVTDSSQRERPGRAHFSPESHHNWKNWGVNNEMNDGRITFRCFTFSVLAMHLLALCHTNMAHWDTWIEQRLMLFVTGVLSKCQLWKKKSYYQMCITNRKESSILDILMKTCWSYVTSYIFRCKCLIRSLQYSLYLEVAPRGSSIATVSSCCSFCFTHQWLTQIEFEKQLWNDWICNLITLAELGFGCFASHTVFVLVGLHEETMQNWVESIRLSHVGEIKG